MFIEQLTDEQLHEFAQSLVKSITKVPEDKWDISVDRTKNTTICISITTSVSESYGTRFYMSDFDLHFPFVGLFDIDSIRSAFSEFMNDTLGPKYLKAYFENAIKILDSFKHEALLNEIRSLMQ